MSSCIGSGNIISPKPNSQLESGGINYIFVAGRVLTLAGQAHINSIFPKENPESR